MDSHISPKTESFVSATLLTAAVLIFFLFQCRVQTLRFALVLCASFFPYGVHVHHFCLVEDCASAVGLW